MAMKSPRNALGSFRDQVVLITGASGGLGSAIARKLADLGAKLALVARTEPRLSALSESLTADYGPMCCAMAADVADLGAMRNAMLRIETSLGVPQVVIHTAGINVPKGVLESSVEEFESVIRTNLTGSFVVAKVAVESMVRAKITSGCILFVSSVQALQGGRSLQYSASKAGIHGLAKSLARQVASMGIRVLVLAPGAMDTEFGRKHWTPEKRRQLESETLLGRIASPEEIADLAVVLTSAASTYMTGTVVNANGGSRLE
ncbi:MAG: SDR family NAD(P)-dependent oxidoreductase [Verrucomicrobia bacterium]|nr:SDR family NAD(P)-dependent oxidoreductase [Verrucomicrobiota bacterium]